MEALAELVGDRLKLLVIARSAGVLDHHRPLPTSGLREQLPGLGRVETAVVALLRATPEQTRPEHPGRRSRLVAQQRPGDRGAVDRQRDRLTQLRVLELLFEDREAEEIDRLARDGDEAGAEI